VAVTGVGQPALDAIIPGWASTTDERLDRELLIKAYRYSHQAHIGQKRFSGDEYVSHCVEVAKILADLQLDSVTRAG
jgi:GTP diphosphokinase / guanosine-3',5'-bis(diphosphate) 3'-diphosphatase